MGTGVVKPAFLATKKALLNLYFLRSKEEEEEEEEGRFLILLW